MNLCHHKEDFHFKAEGIFCDHLGKDSVMSLGEQLGNCSRSVSHLTQDQILTPKNLYQ